MPEQALIRDVSDTASWTAAYRADESERPDALFRDPHARLLAGSRGSEIASSVPGKAVRFGVVVRTAILDREIEAAVRAGSVDAVLCLAAGLDARPYRLDLPADLAWIEADMPGVLAHKETVLCEAVPRCRVERLAVDLTDSEARRAAIAAGAGTGKRVLVVTEGLLGYLAPEQVAELAVDLREHAQVAAWMTDVVTMAMSSSVRDAAHDLKGGQAPILFAPADSAEFFRACGWEEEWFYDYFSEAPKLGRDSLGGKVLRAAIRLLPEHRRTRLERAAGVACLRPVRPLSCPHR